MYKKGSICQLNYLSREIWFSLKFKIILKQPTISKAIFYQKDSLNFDWAAQKCIWFDALFFWESLYSIERWKENCN
jgi:hypothetical protein